LIMFACVHTQQSSSFISISKIELIKSPAAYVAGLLLFLPT